MNLLDPIIEKKIFLKAQLNSLKLIMYQDTFEEDDLIAEVELVAQARYSQNNDVDDGFDTEGNLN